MNKVQPTLSLYAGDTLLATLTNVQLDDWPWYSCYFRPTAAFESHKPLFDKELELLESQGATNEWESAYAKIENLNLRLVNIEDAKEIELFLIHIEDDRARFNPGQIILPH